VESEQAGDRESPEALHRAAGRAERVRVGVALAESERGDQEVRPALGH